MSLENKLQQARSFLSQDKPHLAAEIYEALLMEHPDNLEALLGSAEICLLTDLRHEARSFCGRALEIEPETPYAWTLLALGFEEEDLEKALEYAEQAIALEATALGLFHAARLGAQVGLFEEALGWALEAQKLNPQDLDLTMLLARLYRSNGAFRDALEIWQSLLQQFPRNLTVYIELVELLVELSEVELALDTLTEARRQCGSNALLEMRESQLQALVGNWDRAASLSENLRRRMPDSADAWLNVGIFRLMGQKPEEAEQALLRAYELDETRWEAPFYLAELYNAADLTDKAEEAYRVAIELGTEQWEPLNNLGLLLMTDARRTEEAAHCFAKALDLAPERPESLLNLGLAYFKNNELDNASLVCTQLEEHPLSTDEIRLATTHLRQEINLASA